MFAAWKKRKREQEYYRAMNGAIFFLSRIDALMKRESWSRQKRKQWWSDFIKSPLYRENALRQIFHKLNETEAKKL